MTLAEELQWRGFANQMTFKDIGDINEPRTFYWGVDPSADSMTIGNLAPAMMIRHLIDHGHKAILLVGGATGMVGDPDGKKQERDLKTIDEIASNKAAITRQYKQIFAGKEFEIVDNYDWFKHINYLDFLRDVGKHVSVTQMLDRDFVRSRTSEGGNGLSYAEFSYSLIQGYDYLQLYREKNVTMQVGGSDQWGNMISGSQLVRRIEGGEAHVFTNPLIVNKQTGIKFGKSEGGAIWLDPAKTSPYKFYQFWLNVDDDTAIDLVKVYTLLERDIVEAAIANHQTNTGSRTLQKILAHEVTTLVHGPMRCESVEKVTNVLFGNASITDLSDHDLDELSTEIPTVHTNDLITALAESGLAGSNGDARRLIEGGAISVNGNKVESVVDLVTPSLIKKGKNAFTLVR